MNTRQLTILAALAAALALGYLAHAWTAGPRYIIYGREAPLIKLDTRTGQTWRYYIEADQSQGFTRTLDR